MQPHGRSESFERILSWPPSAVGSTFTRSSQHPVFAPNSLLHDPIIENHSIETPVQKPTCFQRLRARWRVNKSDWIFTTFVVSLQISIGSWQCYRYSASLPAQQALGWGAGLAKGTAGALFPTLFFLIMSMSRWTVTLLRNSKHLSSVINFDKFRAFHIRMAICAFVLSCLHAIGHLSGTFLHGSDFRYRVAVVGFLGKEYEEVTYDQFIFSTPGWTGIVAMVTFLMIVLCSTPPARKWSFELFQYSHLLIYPMIILLLFHGAAHMLQYPVLGFVLAFPTALVLLERFTRLLRIFKGQIADVQPANNDVMHITFPETKTLRWWRYKVGQYVLVRMPAISTWEWHPFTVSRLQNGQMQLYVKTSGEWTKALSRLAGPQIINVDGPFGAPAQQFYEYDHCIVIATGIGVTPCSAILDDMYRDRGHKWACDKPNTSDGGHRTGKTRLLPRFVDFYWSVPDQEMIPWFAQTFSATATAKHNSNIGIRLQVYMTRMQEKELLDKEDLEGLFSRDLDAHINAGRPDYAQLFCDHYEKMRFMQHIYRIESKTKRIGVFFCGAQAARDRLRTLCYENTLKGVMEGSGIEYHFHPEVF